MIKLYCPLMFAGAILLLGALWDWKNKVKAIVKAIFKNGMGGPPSLT